MNAQIMLMPISFLLHFHDEKIGVKYVMSQLIYFVFLWRINLIVCVYVCECARACVFVRMCSCTWILCYSENIY